MNNLKDIVKDDVNKFLWNLKELLFNERDLQMQLAVYLRGTEHYDDVDVVLYSPNCIW